MVQIILASSSFLTTFPGIVPQYNGTGLSAVGTRCYLSINNNTHENLHYLSATLDSNTVFKFRIEFSLLNQCKILWVIEFI